MIWPSNKTQSLIDEAFSNGESLVELDSPRDAFLFRQSIYNKFHYRGESCPFQISVIGSIVKLSKRNYLDDSDDPKPPG